MVLAAADWVMLLQALLLTERARKRGATGAPPEIGVSTEAPGCTEGLLKK